MADKVVFPIPRRLALDCEIWHKQHQQIMAEMRVAGPGIIISFDETKQTATVQLFLREVLNIGGQPVIVTLPLLVDCPVAMFRAGGFMITLPVTTNDECLVIFGDSCMDSWWESGGLQNPMDLRRHDLSDGYCLPMIWSQPNKVDSYSTSSLQIRNEEGTNLIDLSDSALTLTFGSNSIVINASGVEINP